MAGSQKRVRHRAYIPRRSGKLYLRGPRPDLILADHALNPLKNVYLLGTSLARPVIARGMIEIANSEACEQVTFLGRTNTLLTSFLLAMYRTGAQGRATIKSGLSWHFMALNPTSRLSPPGACLVSRVALNLYKRLLTDRKRVLQQVCWPASPYRIRCKE